MTLSDMISLVRIDLKDDSLPYRWADSELERHIAHAVNEYSEALPVQEKAAIQTTAGSREISLSGITGLIMVEAVEYPVDESPPQFQSYSLWANAVTLTGDLIPDGSTARIYYGKLHTLDATTSTILKQHEDLIAAGAAGYAALEWAAYSINKINVGGTGTSEEFLSWGNEKLESFKSNLKKLGRRNKLRGRWFYTI